MAAASHRHAALLQAARDGKTLLGRFNTFHDRATAQVLSAFAIDTALVLAPSGTADKVNETLVA